MRVHLVRAEGASALLAASSSHDLDPGLRRALVGDVGVEHPGRAAFAWIEHVHRIALAQPRPRGTPVTGERGGRVAPPLRHAACLAAPCPPDGTPRPYAAGNVLADLPPTLSPSRISTFTECPRRFRYTAIDRLEEPPSVWTLKGTLVHAALEALFCRSAVDRTRTLAGDSLDAAARSEWFVEGAAQLGLDPGGIEAFVADAGVLLDAYFRMEDPTTVEAVGVELRIGTELPGPLGGAPLQLRGIIDRLDRTEQGLVVVDYKTGRAPLAGREREKLAAVETYALLCERALGLRPVAVRLLYLRDELVVERAVSDREVARQERRAVEVWRAIGRAHAAGEFRPVPSRLCAYCAFNDRCEGAASRRPAAASVGSSPRDGA